MPFYYSIDYYQQIWNRFNFLLKLFNLKKNAFKLYYHSLLSNKFETKHTLSFFHIKLTTKHLKFFVALVFHTKKNAQLKSKPLKGVNITDTHKL